MPKYFLFVLIFLNAATSIAQTFSISGYIKDEKTNEVLIGAQVFVHETKKGAVTNEAGKFELGGLKKGTHHLHIQMLGYQPYAKDISISGNISDLEFSLRPTFIELNQIMVEAELTKTAKQEQTLTMEVIGREYLEKNFNGTLVNSLEKIAGVNTMNVGVGISKPVIRGLSFNRVIVNDQNIKQEGQQWGSDHGLEIDAYNVEQLEIIKGPASLLYGSDGIGGVINISTPAIPKEGTLNGEVFSTYRSNNHLAAVSAKVEGNFNRKFFRIRFSTQDFGDYRVPADSFTYNRYVLPIYNNRLKNTAGKERSISASAGVSGSHGNIRLTVSNYNQQAGLFAGAMGIPRAYDLRDDGNSRNIDLPQQSNNHFKAIVNSKLLLGSSWLHSDLGYQINNRAEKSVSHFHGVGPAPEGNLALGLKLHTLTLNSRFYQTLHEKVRSIYGIQVQKQWNERDGFEFLLSDFESFSSGIFIHEEYKANKKLSISAGIRFDYSNVSVSQYRQPIYANDSVILEYRERTPNVEKNFLNLSGSLGLSWLFAENWNLKFNSGRSFRMPTAPELSMNGVHHGTFRHEMGDTSLNPETGWQFDLGLHYDSKTFMTRLTPYFNYFDNYIYLSPSGGFSPLPDAGQIYKYTQTKALHTGFEAQVEYHPIKQLHIESVLEYIYNINLNTYLPLPFTPPVNIISGIDYTIENSDKTISDISFGVEHYWFATQNRVDRNELVTQGYYLLHFNYGFTLNLKKQPLIFNFRIQNITNTKYMNHLSRYRILNLPEQGINFVVSLKVPINILDKENR